MQFNLSSIFGSHNTASTDGISHPRVFPSLLNDSPPGQIFPFYIFLPQIYSLNILGFELEGHQLLWILLWLENSLHSLDWLHSVSIFSLYFYFIFYLSQLLSVFEFGFSEFSPKFAKIEGGQIAAVVNFGSNQSDLR